MNLRTVRRKLVHVTQRNCPKCLLESYVLPQRGFWWKVRFKKHELINNWKFPLLWLNALKLKLWSLITDHSSHANFEVSSISRFTTFFTIFKHTANFDPICGLTITYIYKNSAIKILFDSLYMETFRFVAWVEIFDHIWAQWKYYPCLQVLTIIYMFKD